MSTVTLSEQLREVPKPHTIYKTILFEHVNLLPFPVETQPGPDMHVIN